MSLQVGGFQNSTYLQEAYVAQDQFNRAQDATRALPEKHIGFILGESVVRPTIDAVLEYGKAFFSQPHSTAVSIDRTFTFPGAATEQNQDRRINHCLANHLPTPVKTCYSVPKINPLTGRVVTHECEEPPVDECGRKKWTCVCHRVH